MKTALRAAGSLLVLVGLVFFALALTGKNQAVSPSGDVTCRMQVREKLISGAYKVYGLKDQGLWLAKAVFHNEMNAPVKDLKVRYKLGDYADWCSWQEYPQLVPTQTVCDLYFPILSSKCAQLTSRTPAELQMEFEYVTASGEKKQVQKSERLTLMGRREFFFTDLKEEEKTGSFQDQDTYSPLLAAWVTAADMPVAGLASLANKRAGGVAAGEDDKQCLAAMEQCYEIMRDIKITYQHPANMVDQSKSYEPLEVQSLQYPRDTIEKRSGTCIDLAILYASMLNSIGIKGVLVCLDGHCFPMAVSPSGTPIPVEATCVGGGPGKSYDFVKAVQIAAKEWGGLQKTGRFDLVRCQECWAQGIAPAELEPLPANILELWNIREAELKKTEPQPAPPEPAPPAQASMAQGEWACTVTQANGTSVQGAAAVTVKGPQVQLVWVAQYSLTGPDDRSHQAHEQNSFQGAIAGQVVTLICRQAIWTLDGVNMRPQGLPMTLRVQLAADGRSAQGAVTNVMGQSAQVTMTAP